MHTSGLTNAPLTKALLIYTIAASIALSILDIKHLASIHVSPHFFPYAQFWRALVWQVAGFTNSTEALFAAMLVYHLRVVERAWGKRKMAVSFTWRELNDEIYIERRLIVWLTHLQTFLLTILPYTTVLPPLLLTLLVRPLSLYTLNYLPPGPTATIFALLAQYHATIPHTFRYRIGTTSTRSTTTTTTTSSSTSNNNNNNTNDSTTSNNNNIPKPQPKNLTLLLSDKSTTYLIALQLSLSQFPSTLLPALTGWIIGVAWRAELLPGLSPLASGFRVPAWMVGERERRGGTGAGNGGGGSVAERERYEDLRRRLEGEVAASGAEGVDGSGGTQRLRRSGDGDGSADHGIMERLRGAF